MRGLVKMWLVFFKWFYHRIIDGIGSLVRDFPYENIALLLLIGSIWESFISPEASPGPAALPKNGAFPLDGSIMES